LHDLFIYVCLQVETAVRLYLALLRGLLLQPGDDVTAASKLSQTLTFRWSDSLLVGATARQAALGDPKRLLLSRILKHFLF